MEQELNEQETRLFDLIGSKSYASLTPEEKQFVALHLSEEEYALQHFLVTQANTLFEDFTPEALPLQLPQQQKRGVVIPLYQALLAVASVVIVFLMLWPSAEQLSVQQQQPGMSAQPFKIFPVRIAHDTVVRHTKETIISERKHTDTVIQYVTEAYEKKTEEPHLLEVSQTLPKPSLDGEFMENRGISLKEDRSSRFIIPVKAY